MCRFSKKIISRVYLPIPVTLVTPLFVDTLRAHLPTLVTLVTPLFVDTPWLYLPTPVTLVALLFVDTLNLQTVKKSVCRYIYKSKSCYEQDSDGV